MKNDTLKSTTSRYDLLAKLKGWYDLVHAINNIDGYTLDCLDHNTWIMEEKDVDKYSNLPSSDEIYEIWRGYLKGYKGSKYDILAKSANEYFLNKNKDLLENIKKIIYDNSDKLLNSSKIDYIFNNDLIGFYKYIYTGGSTVLYKDKVIFGIQLKFKKVNLHEFYVKLYNDKEEFLGNFSNYLETHKELQTEMDKKKKCILELINFGNELDKTFELPICYRDEKILIAIMTIILQGKADTWKEAIILYDTEKFREDLLNSIGDLTGALSNVIRTINNHIEEVLKVTETVMSKLDSINQSVISQEDALRKVAVVDINSNALYELSLIK